MDDAVLAQDIAGRSRCPSSLGERSRYGGPQRLVVGFALQRRRLPGEKALQEIGATDNARELARSQDGNPLHMVPLHERGKLLHGGAFLGANDVLRHHIDDAM